MIRAVFRSVNLRTLIATSSLSSFFRARHTFPKLLQAQPKVITASRERLLPMTKQVLELERAIRELSVSPLLQASLHTRAGAAITHSREESKILEN